MDTIVIDRRRWKRGQGPQDTYWDEKTDTGCILGLLLKDRARHERPLAMMSLEAHNYIVHLNDDPTIGDEERERLLIRAAREYLDVQLVFASDVDPIAVDTTPAVKADTRPAVQRLLNKVQQTISTFVRDPEHAKV